MSTTRVDSSISDHLAYCTCGWRDYPRRCRAAAWQAAAEHEKRCKTIGVRSAAARASQLRHAESATNLTPAATVFA